MIFFFFFLGSDRARPARPYSSGERIGRRRPAFTGFTGDKKKKTVRLGDEETVRHPLPVAVTVNRSDENRICPTKRNKPNVTRREKGEIRVSGGWRSSKINISIMDAYCISVGSEPDGVFTCCRCQRRFSSPRSFARSREKRAELSATGVGGRIGIPRGNRELSRFGGWRWGGGSV